MREVASLPGSSAGDSGSTVVRTAVFALALAVVVAAGLLAAGGVVLSPAAMLAEALLWAPVAWLLARSARSRPRAVLAIGLPVAGLASLHLAKLSMLGAPVFAADLSGFIALLRVLDSVRLGLVLVVLALVAGTLAWTARPRDGGWRHIALVALYVLALVAASPLLHPVLARGWPLPDAAGTQVGLVVRGPSLSLLMDHAEGSIGDGVIPGPGEVLEALGDWGPGRPAGPSFRPRNVHLVLLESIWDARQLSAYRFSEDPFDPRFRAAWEAGGRAHVLSPAFGGATANAELEALCGVQAHRTRVTFVDDVHQPVACLPRVLRDAGYEAYASHPYHADFWNRERVYPLVGFERYRPIDAFVLDDFDGSFLADASLYRQALAWDAGERPKLHYIVSLASHFPYERDRQRRPDLVSVEPRVRLLEDYANASRYATAALMDYTEAVLARDPDALIVVFGDHAPVLGAQPDPFAEAGVDIATRGRTPLLVFDGRHGMHRMEDMPLYLLPAEVLGLLGEDAPRMPHLPADASERAEVARYRSTMKGTVVRGADGVWRVCDAPDPGCDAAEVLRTRLSVLRDDMLHGHQYAMLGQRPGSGEPDAFVTERTAPSCVMRISDWGPRQVQVGGDFNTQPDGRSALWFTLEEARGQPVISVGDVRAPLDLAGRVGSAVLDAGPLVEADARWPVRWSCEDGSRGEIGELVVGEPPARGDATGLVPAEVPVTEPCGLEVEAWGPAAADPSGRFNVQPDGASAFWLRLTSLGGRPTVALGAEPLSFVTAGLSASASRAPDAPPLAEGRYPLSWRCPGGVGGEIGELVVGSGGALVEAMPALPAPACTGGIEAFGPTTIRAGEAFNTLPDGRSALWVRLREGTSAVGLRLAGRDLAVARSGSTLSAAIDDDMAEVFAREGEVAIELTCAGGVVDARSLTVQPASRLPRDPPAYAGPPRPALIAHAGGEIHGLAYTNAREALDANHDRGHRYFEVDIEWTTDGQPVLLHDWGVTWERLFGGGERPDLAGFKAATMAHGLTSMSLSDALDWLAAHPEAFLVTDTKAEPMSVLEWIATEAPGLRGQVIPQVYEPDQIAQARALGFDRVILTVYRSRRAPSELVAEARAEGAWALTVPEAAVRSGAFDAALMDAGMFVYVHTINAPSVAQSLRDGGVDGFYTDRLAPGVDASR